MPKKISFLLLTVAIFCFMWIGLIPSAQAANFFETQVLKVIKDHPEVLMQSLEEYQNHESERQYFEQQERLDSIRFKAPELLASSPHTGVEKPSVYLIEFSDFQCPYCKEAQAKLPELLKKHSNLALIYKNLPLPMHEEAFPAAQAAWAAYQQGKFWQFHDALFSNQEILSTKSYPEIAENLGLDLSQFSQDQNSSDTFAALEKDVDLANKLGIQGTPFFIVTNGVSTQTVSGADIASLESAISQLVASAQ